MIVRITGSGFVKTGSVTDGHPVEFRHWKEVVDSADNFLESAATSEDEEAIVELWLEDPLSFQAGLTEEDGTPVVSPKISMVARADRFGAKRATPMGPGVRQSNWDQEFADAQAHAKSVMAKLGNGR